MSILKLKAKSLLKSFVLITSLSSLFYSLAHADSLSEMPDDIIIKIFEELTEKDIQAWGRLKTLDRRFRGLGQTSLEKAKLTKYGVSLQNGDQALADIVIKTNHIKDIASFNSPEAFAYFLENAPIDSLKDLWSEETFLAANAAREPSYLSQISQTKGKILSSFMEKKKGQALTKQDLSRLAYSLLFSSKGFEDVAWHAAWHAAWDAAGDAAWTAARNAARNAAWTAARHAAGNAADAAARNAAAWDAAWSAAMNAAWDAAKNAAQNAAREEIFLRNLTTPEAIVHLSYRVAEKVSLLYFLKEANRVLEASFQAAYDSLPVVITDKQNIFSSEESWEAFKSTHFSRLSAAQRESLNPWLLELDTIVAAIAGASNTPSNTDS